MKLTLKSMMVAALCLVTMAARAASRDPEPVVTPTQSVEQADATLARVTRDRATVASTFAAEEAVCYDKFFTTNCLDQAKEKRRLALAQLRAEEVEAEHFKRAASVAKRDADLAERARKDGEEFARREAKQAARSKPVRSEEELAQPAPPKGGKSLAERQAAHAERLRRDAARTASAADQRAANVAAYEKKQADAARRQQQVAERLEKRRAKAAARAADEQKKAAAAAAAASAAAAKN
ncbi:hypothetical protein ASF61_16540 [Duganella sp. Leaf126]|uniref:hypothetical protein n=1 Tax=Duganella sp. Leaf126 TaxID=1736266 RepID=UPI0006FB6D20|nr:hypothetical protein [Duganella sp. Leaf126]KQQ31945.1 hypothetical protein ASF61_16540 [Duganella sp. Leaf126]